MFSCSAEYIPAKLGCSLPVYFISTLYVANEAWIHGPPMSAKVSGSESASDRDRSPLIVGSSQRLPLIGLTPGTGSGFTDD